MLDEPWAGSAACVGEPQLFFADDPDEPFERTVQREAAAVALCAGCPAREPCLRYAVEQRVSEGVWGGLLASERRGLRPEQVASTAAGWVHAPHRRRRRSRSKAALAARAAEAARAAAESVGDARTA